MSNEALEITKSELAMKMSARHLFLSASDIWEALKAATGTQKGATCVPFVRFAEIKKMLELFPVPKAMSARIEGKRHLGVFAEDGKPRAAMPAGVTKQLSFKQLTAMIEKHARFTKGVHITHITFESDGRVTYRIEKRRG
jgi:hypothetical protein